jgi:hypothetical protein
MAFNTTTRALPAFNLKFSSFLGGLYEASKANEELVEKAKALVGEDEVKKGFQGRKGDVASAKALRFLQEQGMTLINSEGVVGKLTSASIKDVTVGNNRKLPYLQVGLADDDGRYYISLGLDNDGAQALVRKLINCKPGTVTSVNLFSTYELKEGAAQAYAEQGCSVKQVNDEGKMVEVPAISFSETFKPQIDAAMEKLTAAGIDDRETLNRRRDMAKLQAATDLMIRVAKTFSDFYGAKKGTETGEAA